MSDPSFQMQVGACQVTGHFFGLDDDQDMSLSSAENVLSADEHARAARFKYQIHRDRFTRGRGYLRKKLAEHLEIFDPASLVFETVAQDKPALAGDPLWFNLSHSQGDAVLVLSKDGPLGVDLERHDRRTDVAALAPSVFTQAECDLLNAQSDIAAKRRLFFLFWTAKEARMKLTGEGMSLNPKNISLRLEGGIPASCILPENPETVFSYVSGLTDASCAVAAPRLS